MDFRLRYKKLAVQIDGQDVQVHVFSITRLDGQRLYASGYSLDQAWLSLLAAIKANYSD